MQVKKSTGFNGRVNDIKSGSIQYKIKGKEVDLMHAHNQQGFVVPFSNFSMFTRCVTVVKFSTSLYKKKIRLWYLWQTYILCYDSWNGGSADKSFFCFKKDKNCYFELTISFVKCRCWNWTIVPKLISPNFSMIRAVCGVKLLFSLQYDSIITRNHAYILASYLHTFYAYVSTYP